ncbi:hypothetical protein BO70DRAFT_426879 [Aspergillus heteromorphus CBS 117.55]|uniref:Uncharacterized protein n=1 Tax=Aspergillus heteromorphus CBS 117.55 TaxID=1448321 RepID=A0A317WS23_9EURO|nr:uncharacterized protein BO70DRAFT_426879 [Aspergillus heteromorphus CBS 117.55]PWY89244.1 hypothetical protein BO70DRAFT_426879 [Aspergillus heteromorphus CBS 117.55]
MDITSCLPMNTVHAIGSTSSGICAVIQDEMRKKHPAPYVSFSHVPPALVRESLDNPEAFGSRAVRICYDEDTRRLIVKIPGNQHEVATWHLSKRIINDTTSMGLDDQLLLKGAARVEDAPVKKEPDASFRPVHRPPGRDQKWPSVVIESGWSESDARLEVDANLWIGRSEGLVQVVIAVCIDRDQELVTFKKYVPAQAPLPRLQTLRSHSWRAALSETIAVSRVNQVVTVTGAPLTIRFEEMFLRPASSPLHVGYTFDAAALQKVAEMARGRLAGAVWAGSPCEGGQEVTGAPFVIRFEDMFLRPARGTFEMDYVFDAERRQSLAELVWDEGSDVSD